MAVWLDFPAEILEKFLVSLDNIDLVYRIANVDRTLNSLALKEYFRRFAVVGVECVVVGNMDTRLALRALRSALWIKRVPTLTVRLSPSPSMFREVHDLTRFIRQLNSLGALNLYILGHGYMPLFMSAVERTKLGNIWWKCFGALLEAALLRGVGGLCVFEPAPDMLQKYIRMDHQPPIQEYEKLRYWVMKRQNKLLSYIRGAGEDHYNIPDPLKDPVLHLLERGTRIHVWDKPSVRDMHISRMLLSPLFFRDTLDILSAHAHTIYTVNLHEIVMDQKCWKMLLENLQIPLLERFTFTGPSVFVEQDSLIPIDTLLLFLHRHSKITHLQLNNILPECIPESLSKHKLPSMLNLTALTAHAALAGPLLQHPDNCRHLEFLCLSCLSPHSSGATRSVGICAPEFDLALAAIASNVSHPVMIELELETAIDLHRWMGGESGPQSASIPRTLTHVHDITIFLCGNDTMDTHFLAKVLPKWLGSFPALQRLHIHIDARGKKTLSPAVIDSCPHLQTFMINYEVILSIREDS